MEPMTASQSVAARQVPPFITAPFDAQTWRDFGYLTAHLLLASFAFAYVVFVPSFAAGVLVTVVGLWLVGVLVVAARGWGTMYRALTRHLVGVDIAPPPRFVMPRSFWRGLAEMFGDVDGWRALAFMFLMLPLSIISWTITVVFLALGVGGISYVVYRPFLPAQQAPDGSWHHGAQFFGTKTWGWYADTPPRIFAVTLFGLACLWAWPAVQRGLVAGFTLLARWLLGPSRASLQAARLRSARADVVEDSAARLRRIERDLHDGTQARLVAVAMQLGEAREQLGPDGDHDLAAQLVESAHTSAKETLTELRDIARGIHPPALDAGLAVALETLVSRSVLPVILDVVVDDEPLEPAIGSIAYYTVAELLTNATKHAEASAAHVKVSVDDATVHLVVSDNGIGGAQVHEPSSDGHRSGLAGLVERVGSVDGTFDLSSPSGGPTVVTVTLPTSTQL